MTICYYTVNQAFCQEIKSGSAVFLILFPEKKAETVRSDLFLVIFYYFSIAAFLVIMR